MFKSRGFSLIELAIVLVISSLIMVSIIKVYDLYSMQQKREDTLKKVEKINVALSNFYSSKGRYPCPADPALSVRAHNTATFPFDEAATLVPPVTGVPVCSLPTVPGQRKTAAPGAGATDPVTIGSVPYAALGITQDDAVDAWGYQIQYAVSTNLTATATYDNAFGAIGVTTEPLIVPPYTGAKPLVDPPNSAHLVIVAFGPDHMGAHSADGKITVPCAAGKQESNNCNGSTAFVEGIRANDFDDIVTHTTRSLTRLWDFTATGSTDIYNVNTGNVGVGTATPQARLDVNGNLAATKAQQPKFCDDGAPQKCWDPGPWGSTAGDLCDQSGLTAGQYRVVSGIKGGRVACVVTTVPTPSIAQSCVGAGQYVKGFDNLGNIICGTPTSSP